MLNNKKITMTADSIVDGAKIANFVATYDVDKMKLSFISRNLDDEACKANKEIVRKDRADFEDFAYSLQDSFE